MEIIPLSFCLRSTLLIFNCIKFFFYICLQLSLWTLSFPNLHCLFIKQITQENMLWEDWLLLLYLHFVAIDKTCQRTDAGLWRSWPKSSQRRADLLRRITDFSRSLVPGELCAMLLSRCVLSGTLYFHFNVMLSIFRYIFWGLVPCFPVHFPTQTTEASEKVPVSTLCLFQSRSKVSSSCTNRFFRCCLILGWM